MKNQGKKIKAIILFFIVLISLFLLYKFFIKTNSEGNTLALSAITKGNIENVVTATGIINPKASVDIGSQISGQVIKIHVDVGDEVKNGQLLAEIDRTVLETKVESSEADLKYQQAQLKDRKASLSLAKITYDRQKKLLENNATSQESYDSAKSSLLSAEASIDMINAQIEQTKSYLKENQANLEYTLIYATMNGTVTSVEAKEGQTLNANQNTPTILTIANLETVTVQASVSEADVGKLKTGMDVYFKTLGSSNIWRTKLSKIEPTPVITNNVVLYNALFDVENSSHELMTSMTTQVFFVLASANNTLLAPISAVKIDDKNTSKGLIAVKNSEGSLENKKVELGVRNRVHIEILKGVQENDVIAINFSYLDANKKKNIPQDFSNRQKSKMPSSKMGRI